MTDAREGNRNAMLALHFSEGEAEAVADARAHAAGCADCREYLAVLTDVQTALLEWADEPAPADLRDRVLVRAARSARQAPAPRPAPSAMPLLALVPVLASLALSIHAVAAQLEALPFWPKLAAWPVLEMAAPVGAAALMMLALGAFVSLALAPALVLESGGRPRWID